jgi:hypothetical protein
LEVLILNIDIFADSDNSYVQNLKRSVREAALSMKSCNSESLRESHSDESSEHFFVPLSTTGFSNLVPENKVSSFRSKRLFVSRVDNSLRENHAPDGSIRSKYDEFPDMLNDLDSLHGFDSVNGFLSVSDSNGAASDAQRSFYDFEESQEQVFSPPFLMDTSLLADSYEDLLGTLVWPQTIPVVDIYVLIYSH